MNQIIRREIEIDAFSPVILRSSCLATGMKRTHGDKFTLRTVYDYELELYTESEGAMLLDGTLYSLKKGSIAFRRPGQVTQGILPYNCYLICFDLMGNTGKDPDHYSFLEKQAFQNYYTCPLLDAIQPLTNPVSDTIYRYLFEGVLREFIHNSYGNSLQMKAYVLQILYHLYLDSGISRAHEELPLSAHFVTIKSTCNYINDNLENKIRLEDISKIAGMSIFHFHKIFTRSMGMTPVQYITEKRLERAKELLVKTSLPVGEISYECGYDNVPYFCSLFKKNSGSSPGEFRKKHSYV